MGGINSSLYSILLRQMAQKLNFDKIIIPLNEESMKTMEAAEVITKKIDMPKPVKQSGFFVEGMDAAAGDIDTDYNVRFIIENYFQKFRLVNA